VHGSFLEQAEDGQRQRVRDLPAGHGHGSLAGSF
jgi:hypothetical protein